MDTNKGHLPSQLETPNTWQRRTFTVTCAHCGQRFDTASDRARYCPPPKGCKQAAYRERKERAAADTV